jgi:hypothetical protein
VLAVEDDATLETLSSALLLGQHPPLDYPRVACDDVFVYIVSMVEDAPEHSAASIGVGRKAPARFRRPGEKIGEWRILAISDDRTGLNPGVWLEKDGAVCRAELEGNPARIVSKPKPKPRVVRNRRRGRR